MLVSSCDGYKGQFPDKKDCLTLLLKHISVFVNIFRDSAPAKKTYVVEVEVGMWRKALTIAVRQGLLGLWQ